MDDLQQFKKQREDRSAQVAAERERLGFEDWNGLGGAAYDGFLRFGRGVMLCNIDGSKLSATYYRLEADAIQELGIAPECLASIAAAVALYNPELEFITIAMDQEDWQRWGRQRVDPNDPRQLSPRAAYESRPEPIGPAATVHRLSDWGDGAA